MRKYLIINCDDFGQSKPMNQAIMHILEEEKASSATIMPPAPRFEEAAAWIKKRGQKNVGLHLTLTSEFEAVRWKSLTGDSSLHDDTGHLYKTVEEFEQHADTKEIVRELIAQYEKVKRAGISISHVDNHMGSLYGVATGRSHLPQVLRLCSKWKLPFRLFRKIHPGDALLSTIPEAEQLVTKVSALAGVLGVAIPDYLLSHPYHIVEGETYDVFKKSMMEKIYNLPEGISETYIHPAVEDSYMLREIPDWEKRVWEYKLMFDADFAYAMKDAGVTLTTYDHVRKYGKDARIRSAVTLVKELVKGK